MNNKGVIIVAIFLVLTLFGFSILNIINANIEMENETKELTYSFTKAICNENNYCEDYEIVCNNNEISKLTPTGFAVQFPKQWEDPRIKEDVEIKC